MVARTLSHYEIEARLGAGGMGEVYLARDLALGRRVALKVLAGDFSPSLKARLLREAVASARLQHPGIATFFEAGEADETAFIAMEYVAGRTLRARLREGPLPIDAALALAAGLLEALAHAHAAGILHRDIKPENIMLAGERAVKLLDFGLAKEVLVEASSPTTDTATVLTGEGMIVGTVGYMAPEQLSGGAVDARADLFSLAAVLYEAIVGCPAFPGSNATERIAAILTKDPPPLSGPGLPPGLQTLLSRAFERDPARRYASARAFLSDLHRLGSGELPSALPDTLTILDFEPLSRDPSDDWIGSGIAESVAADLVRVPGLTVLAREKVLKARAAILKQEGAIDAAELGLRLGCRFVLTGAYQRLGPALRVTARLLEASTGRIVTAEKVDSTVDCIFEVQDRLAAACVSALKLKAPNEVPHAAPALSAYEAYARGRRLWLRMAKGSFEDARELYEKAIALESAYAPALSGLAAVHALRFTFTTDPRELDAARDYARRAIAADPRLGEPHIWLGYVLMRQGQLASALAEEQEATRAAPDNHFGPYFCASIHLAAGRPREALAPFQRAIELDSQAAFNWLGLGWTHLCLHQDGEAIWSLRQAIALEKQGGGTPTAGVASFLGECLRRAGELAEARAECLAGIEAAERSDHMYRDTFRGVGLCALGRTALDQRDVAAAHAAFAQAVAHLRGRLRSLGGGHLVVQALAGLARAGEGALRLDEALGLFESREGHDFSWFYGCSDDVGLADLARAAYAVGRPDEAGRLWERARAAGSPETPGTAGS